MDLKEIRQIVALMEEHGLSFFHLEKQDFNIKLKKGTDLEAMREFLSAMPSGPPMQAPAGAAPAAAAPVVEAVEADEGEAITSPMVGTFYRKPAPDAPDFVEVGSTVSAGQTICIIEAMKVMNEIKAERGGTIAEVCVQDGTPVQYGDDLFRIK